MKIENIKKEFPIFNNKVQNNDLVYLDSANSSQKPLVVVDRIYDFYTKDDNKISVHETRFTANRALRLIALTFKILLFVSLFVFITKK